MRLTTVLLIATMMQVSAASFAQKISLKEKNAPLEKIFNQIRLQSGYDFLFNRNLIKNAKPVNVHVKDVSLEEALEECFVAQPFTYTLQEKTIVIKEKEPSFLDRLAERWAAVDVGGTVVDEEGNPLPGASVRVKNGKQATITDQYGGFYLKGVAEDALIVISYIGYKPAEIAANFLLKGPTIPLKRSESKLDEVQVMAYGITSRRTSTSNIATIKAEDIAKQDVNNPLLALQGRVAGLIITPSSGVPGSPVSVQIRGVNTLSGSLGLKKTAEPLFVIDGIPYSNNVPAIVFTSNVGDQMSAFSFVNPADIESIDVLKDADATAIYGSRGANGVILITTKKGKMGSNSINVNFSSGYGQVTKKLNLLNTERYLEMRKEAFKNDGLPLPTDPDPSNYDLTVWDQGRYTDWQEEMIGGTARYTNAQASISGGTPTVQYLISGTYNKQGYVFPGEAKNESGNGHFSIMGNSLNNKFNATLTGTYAAIKDLSAADFTQLAMQLPPNAPPIHDANGGLNWEPDPNTGFGTWQNPYARLLTTSTAKTNVINSSADLSYKLLSSLTVKATIGFSEVRGSSVIPFPLTSFNPEYVRLGYVTGNSLFNTNSSRSWSVEPQALYNTLIGKGRLHAIAGASLQYQDMEFQELYAYGYTSDALLRNLGSAAGYSSQNTSSQYKYKGIFGRLTYNWTDKYILNLNVRRDGSSRFGTRQQYGNFGSVGAAWIFTNEAFLQKALPFMSFGKLRFSYGTSGNDGIGDYQYLELYRNLQNSPTYQGVQGLVSNGVTNPYYHWEETRKAEVGMELGFLKDRILLSTAYFRNRSSDQLGAFPIPATAGASSNFVVNREAKIQSSGLEFLLNTQNIKSKSFMWSTSANISFPRNKLLALPTGGVQAYGLSIEANVGDPYSGISYVAIAQGVDPATGRYRFTDVDGSPTFDSGVRKAVITTPKFNGGLSNTFNFKGIGLDIFLQFTKQMGRNYLYDASTVFKNAGNFVGGLGLGNMPAEVLTRWQKPGDNSNIQRFTTQSSGDIVDSWGIASFSTDAYVDASFIRVKNVSLSYKIPELWNHKLGIKSLRVYLQGQNLLTLTNYKGLDPETQTVMRLPQLRVLTTGIQAGF